MMSPLGARTVGDKKRTFQRWEEDRPTAPTPPPALGYGPATIPFSFCTINTHCSKYNNDILT